MIAKRIIYRIANACFMREIQERIECVRSIKYQLFVCYGSFKNSIYIIERPRIAPKKVVKHAYTSVSGFASKSERKNIVPFFMVKVFFGKEAALKLVFS